MVRVQGRADERSLPPVRHRVPSPSLQPLQRGLCCPCCAYKEAGGESLPQSAQLASGRAGLELGVERASGLRLRGLGWRLWVPREWQGPAYPTPPVQPGLHLLGLGPCVPILAFLSPQLHTELRRPMGTEASEVSEA